MNLRNASMSLALVALVALAACGDDTTEPAATEGATDMTSQLDGRTFLSADTSTFEVVADSVVSISFTADSLSVNGGCNMMNGGYTIDGDTLKVDALAMTQMACEAPLMDQDTRLTDFLSSGPTVAVDGSDLTLTKGESVLAMVDRKVADPDRPLEGSEWTVTTIIANEAASTVPTGATATITIADGTASVAAGCNTGSAAVVVGDGTITFSPLALTMKMCDDGAMELEAAVIATLTGEVTYEIEADTLTLTNGDTGLQLTTD